MSSLQYLEVVIYFLILTELTSFLLSFVLWSFQVLGKDSMDYGIRSGKSLSLGIPKAPQGNIQGQPRAEAWGCPGWHPIFHLRSSVTLLGAIFLFATWYVFYLERQFILLGFSCCYLEQCFASFISIKVALIAFTMPILEVHMLLFENRKFTDVAIIPWKSQNVIKCWTLLHIKIW